MNERPSMLRRRGFLAAVGGGSGAVAGVAGCLDRTGDGPDDGEPAPESVSGQADWVELDVYPTSDGEIVVFHDELGGLTDTRDVIHELVSSEVLSAEVLES